MVIRIEDYQYKYHIFSFSKDQQSLESLLKQNLDVLYLDSNALYIFPYNKILTNDIDVLKQFSECSNYDVFEISEDGNAYLYYDSTSNDNAFVVTQRCNSNCIMCPDTEFHRRERHDADVGNLLTLIKHIPDDASHFTITGGEPFLLKSDIFTFFKALQHKLKESRFLLLTNGRALSINDYCIKLKESLPQNTIIGIPLHGYNASTHDAITQTVGSFGQTVLGVSNLLSLGLYVEIRIVVSKLNYEYINKIADFIVVNFKGICRVKIMGLEMLGNAVINRERVWISYKDAFEASVEAVKTLIMHNIDVGLYNFPLCAVDEKYWNICEKSITRSKIRFCEDCNACELKDACGGMFVGSKKYAEKDIVPIIKEKL